MLEPKEVVVNGRKYTVNPMDPMGVFELYYELDAAVRTGRSRASANCKALRQCTESEMERKLDDTTVFQTTFARYPEDMVPLAEAAIEVLVGPFVKRAGDTTAAEKN